MASITLRNVPEDLYRKLSERAESHRRSVEDEALDCLGDAVGARSAESVERVLDDLRRFRESVKGVYVTDDELRRAIDEGRP
jgi:antitoxin FitA